jgi:hypothetical protein
MDLIHRPEHTDMVEDDTISTSVDFATVVIEYETQEFLIKDQKIPNKKEQIKIEHVKLGRNNTSGSSGLF